VYTNKGFKVGNVCTNKGGTLFKHTYIRGNELKWAMCVQIKEVFCSDTFILQGMG
jgi:hypothetical protein